MSKMFMKNCKAWILDMMFPNRCPFCSEIIMWNKYVCDECRSKLVNACDVICHKCGGAPCSCSNSNKFDSAYAAVFFDDENVSDAIYDFKQIGMSNLAEYTAEIVCKYIDEADLVCSVPMGKNKLRSRGHNQADILAECIGERLNIEFCKNLLYKIDTKEEQHYFNEEERAERVKDLFYKSSADLTGKTIILCDDVMTTGSTLNRCAELLKEMGADKIVVCVCAVTRLEKSHRKG